MQIAEFKRKCNGLRGTGSSSEKKAGVSLLSFLFLIVLSLLITPSSSVAEEAKADTATKSAEQTTKKKKPSKEDIAFETIFNQKQTEVDVVADQLEYARGKKKVIARKNVVISYRDIKITADYAEVETDTKKAYAKGHVLLFRGDNMASKGEELHYDFESGTGNFPGARVIHEPWFGHGEDIKQVKKGVIEICNGTITTCSQEKPYYSIRAKKTTIISGDKMVAKNVTIYILDKPVFWLPYLTIPLQGQGLPFSINPGYNSEFGAYIETAKGFSINKNISGKILADWRKKRGFGVGGIVGYDFGDYASGQIIGYWTQDDRAPTPGFINEDGLSDPYGQREDRDRGRITWRHRSDFGPHTHIIGRYHRVADEFFLRDFFEKEDRLSEEQHSFVALTHNTEKYGILGFMQKRMNRFERVVERLPQVRFDWKNQPLMKPWLFYESQSSFNNFTKRFGRASQNEDAVRVDSFHELSVPLNWNHIKFTPFVNLRGTYYSRESESDNDRFRTAVGFGFDLRTQYYKTYNTSFDFLGMEVNNIRHVFEPSLQVSSIHPSTVSDEEIRRFDHIDTIDDQDVFTFGIENRIQTKRVIEGVMQRIDIVSLNTFLSYEFKPDGTNEFSATDRSGFKFLTQEVVLRPYQWLQYQARFRYDMERDQFRVFNQDIVLRAHRFSFLFGHRFVKDPKLVTNDGELDSSNLVLFQGSYTINPLWKLGGYIRFDADDQDLEEWQIYATRTLACDWLLDIGYNVRNSDISSSNKELYFNLRLQSYPDIAVRGGSRATFSAPRIGETVAGANQYGSRWDPF